MPHSPSKNRKGRPSTFDRKSTVSLAMNCYWEEGLLTLSFNELCRRIGSSKPTIYREFGGEDGLLKEVLNHYKEEILNPIFNLLEGTKTAQQRVHDLIDRVTQPQLQNLGCLFVKMQLSSNNLDEETVSLIQEINQQLNGVYLKLIKEGQSQGFIHSEMREEFAATYIDTQLTTMLLQMSLGMDPFLVRKQGKLAVSVLFTDEHYTDA